MRKAKHSSSIRDDSRAGQHATGAGAIGKAASSGSLLEAARRRLFHLYFLLSRPLTLGARAIVLRPADGHVLLVRHTYVPGWQLPGGGVEPGETLEEALARELLEEGNITLTAPPELCSIHFNAAASRRDHVALYLVRSFRQSAERVPDREIAETGFFAPDTLPEGVTAATQRRLAEVLDGAPVSPWW